MSQISSRKYCLSRQTFATPGRTENGEDLVIGATVAKLRSFATSQGRVVSGPSREGQYIPDWLRIRNDHLRFQLAPSVNDGLVDKGSHLLHEICRKLCHNRRGDRGAPAGDERLDGGLLRLEPEPAQALFLGRDARITDVILAHGEPICICNNARTMRARERQGAAGPALSMQGSRKKYCASAASGLPTRRIDD